MAVVVMPSKPAPFEECTNKCAQLELHRVPVHDITKLVGQQEPIQHDQGKCRYERPVHVFYRPDVGLLAAICYTAGMITKIRYTDTPNLLRIVKAGRIENYNRQLDEEADKMFDPQGRHVVTYCMIHEHKAGERVAPHMRAMMLTKVKGKDEPQEITLDMSMEDFDTFNTKVGDVAN